MRPARSRSPSIVDLTFLLWVLVVPTVLSVRSLNADGDVARHLRMGDFILEGGLAQVDTFAYTKTGPFLPTEWLSQVTYALVERAAGLAGVAVFVGLIVALFHALIVWQMRRSGVDPLLAWMTGVVVAVLTSVHWAARPHLFTFLGVTLTLQLALFARGRTRWLAAPFFLVWANYHPGFALGLAILFAFTAGDVAEAALAGQPEARSSHLKRARDHGLMLGLGALASLVNPQGAGLHVRIRNVLDNRFLMQATEEFRPIEILSLYGGLVLGVVGLIVLAYAMRRTRPSLPVLFVVLGTLIAGAMARRNLPLFALASLPLVAIETGEVWRSLRWRWLTWLRQVFAAGDAHARAVRYAPFGALVMIGVALAGGSVAGWRLVPDAFDARVFPVEAVEAARAAGLEGRIFNEFRWGGYLVYAWPEQRIFIDGMTDFLGNDVFRSYLKVDALEDGWLEELARHDVSIVLVPRDSRVARALMETGAWAVWHEDSTAVLLQRRPA